MQSIHIGKAANMGFADENLRYAALACYLLHFLKCSRTVINIDFFNVFYTQLR